MQKEKISISRDKIKQRTIKGVNYYYYNYYYNSRQKTFYGKSRKELLEKFQNFIIMEEDNKYDLRGVQFQKLYESFLTHKKGDVKQTTYASYISIYKNHIYNSKLGKMNIKDVKDIEIKSFINNLELSYRSKQKVLAHLNSFYSWCVRLEYINKNYCKEIKLKNYAFEEGEDKYITKDIRDTILKDIRGDKKEVVIRLMILYGLRLGEALAVNKKSIISTNKININKAVIKYSEGGKSVNTLSSPKNKYSCRIITIDDYTYSLISKSNWRIIDRSTIQTYLKKKYNINCHSLRHSLLTDMVQSGVSIEVIKRFAGHSKSSSTLLSTYTHLQDSYISSELNKFYK